jgi:excisionase family DNA binding protein
MPDESFPPTSPFLTVQEVALYTRLSPRHIRRLIARGELRVTRMGRAIRVHRRDLDSYLGQ